MPAVAAALLASASSTRAVQCIRTVLWVARAVYTGAGCLSLASHARYRENVVDIIDCQV